LIKLTAKKSVILINVTVILTEWREHRERDESFPLEMIEGDWTSAVTNVCVVGRFLSTSEFI